MSAVPSPLALLGCGAAAATASAPTNLAATAGNAEVALTWDEVTGADGYYVHYDTDSGDPYANSTRLTVGALADSSNPSYTVTGLTNGTLYYFAVTSFQTV